jgi:two-component system, LytTR family, response regulator
MYCEAVDNFTRFHFETDKPLLICRTLKFFEDLLSEYKFLRIHRSFLINPGFVIRYSKGKGGYITLKNNKELEVSANKKKEFLEAFGK